MGLLDIVIGSDSMRVGIYSLGCKVNIYESEYVTYLLKNHGYEIVPYDSVADIYIINTCSVTNEADKKSRKIIRQAKRHNPEAIVIVMGCYSQINSSMCDADIVIGNRDKSKILDYIEEYFANNKKIEKIYNLRNEISFEDMNINSFESHTRAFVKIQDGCNAFCSYCIIPYTRGAIRSKKKEDVIREVTNLVNNGYKEIVLTGIHTGKYGMDLKDTNLEDLLRELVKIDNLYKIRLSSIEINEITSGIMDLIKNNEKLASHLHIPIQSGSDDILSSMNRKYDKKYFIDRVKEIKKLRSDISITTDLIVGFPGETDDNFNETIKTIKEIGFTKIHTFPYSVRDNTPAGRMKNQVDDRIKKKRVKEILKISFELEKEYYSKYIGCELEGLSEERHDKSFVLTSNYISVILDEKIDNNKVVRVKINRVDDNSNQVYGKIIKSGER